MSKKDKLVERLKSRPKDFTWEEAAAVMKGHGFEIITKDGSRRLFRHTATKVKASLHQPHPGNILKPYMLDLLIEALQNAGEIE